jgi:hypothetical protein
MPGPRVDYLTDPQPLLRLGVALLVAGSVVAAVMSLGVPWWLFALGALCLLACGLGLFVVSARWFTREHPVLTLHTDRLTYRGLREQVVMLRSLASAQVVDQRRFGVTVPWLVLERDDDDEPVRWPLWALQLAPDALLEAITARVHALERDRVPAP